MGFTKSAEDRIAASVRFTEDMSTPLTPQKQSKKRRVKEYIVKLTAKIGGSARKWEAIEQYIDSNGDPQDMPSGEVFDADTPVFLVADGSVDDVIVVKAKYRPDDSIYWLGGSAGTPSAVSSGGRIMAINQTTTTNGAGTWVKYDIDDKGTFADEAALLLAWPPPASSNYYAYVTATTSYWLVNSAGDWYDTGQSTKAGAGLEGSWTTAHKIGTQYSVECEANAVLFLDQYNNIYYANDAFAAFRGV